tara:strand:- start:521 stop:706 length:186 start_codon:yes stop_codon:yes gene_type:complete
MKVAIIATIFTLFHLVEDLIWLTVGRYTNIPYWVVGILIVIIGIMGGVLVRHPKAKKFLGH